jgi:hypothetical protein
MLKGQWILHCANAHGAHCRHYGESAGEAQHPGASSHPINSPDLTPADLFLFSKVKEHLADFPLALQDTFKSTCRTAGHQYHHRRRLIWAM